MLRRGHRAGTLSHTFFFYEMTVTSQMSSHQPFSTMLSIVLGGRSMSLSELDAGSLFSMSLHRPPHSLLAFDRLREEIVWIFFECLSKVVATRHTVLL
ncbi:uncharacterized protein [Lolium perenne]|uniref:uncharacterized protein isoform X2 n=1 Tax=Lolium perenne TaxID=4522 RepID=UPI003A997048